MENALGFFLNGIVEDEDAALLLPDPCDTQCPEAFKQAARAQLPAVGCGAGETDEDLRRGLLKFVADFANWDVAARPAYLEVSRALVRAAHGAEPPLVVDPFAGGGSIPLKALRLGCEAFASDLSPVACLILKVMLADIPRHGPGLADELRRVGAEIKAKAEVELAGLYPKDPDGATPIAYLWARTALRSTQLWGRDTDHALVLAVQEADAQAGAAGSIPGNANFQPAAPGSAGSQPANARGQDARAPRGRIRGV